MVFIWVYRDKYNCLKASNSKPFTRQLDTLVMVLHRQVRVSFKLFLKYCNICLILSCTLFHNKGAEYEGLLSLQDYTKTVGHTWKSNLVICNYCLLEAYMVQVDWK